MNPVSMSPIGVIRSPYQEKFAIPRQAGLVKAAGELHLLPPYNQPDAVRELQSFSHIWLIFLFHLHQGLPWRASVRPPRLGGNAKVGVFASRSPFRPNPIGLSLVTLEGISYPSSQVILHLNGLDLLDRTPVLDIKPYLPYADTAPAAHGGYAHTAPAASLPVSFTDEISHQLARLSSTHPDFADFIRAVLAQDPRPAYQRGDPPGREYAARLADFNVCWRITPQGAQVFALEPLEP